MAIRTTAVPARHRNMVFRKHQPTRSMDSKRTKTGGSVLQERYQPVEKVIKEHYNYLNLYV